MIQFKIMKEYLIRKGLFTKITLAFMSLFFGAIYFSFGHIVFLFTCIFAVLALGFVICSGDTKVLSNEKGITIIKMPFRILPKIFTGKTITFSYGDIQRITQLNSLWYAFHVIRLKNGKTISLLRESSPEFDDFLSKLNLKLTKESAEYKEYNSLKDNKGENYRILLILLLTLVLPLSLVVGPVVQSEIIGWIIISIPCAAIIVLAFLISKS